MDLSELIAKLIFSAEMNQPLTENFPNNGKINQLFLGCIGREFHDQSSKSSDVLGIFGGNPDDILGVIVGLISKRFSKQKLRSNSRILSKPCSRD